MANFNTFLPKLLKHEGGFVDDPQDLGGATNKGITLKTFRQKYPSATVADLKNISDADVYYIYKNWYWDKLRGDDIAEQNVAESIVDHGVNAGVRRAAQMVQYVLNTHFSYNLAIDGIMGNQTLAALAAAGKSFYTYFLALRKKYYHYRAGVTHPDADTAFFEKTLRISPARSQQKFVRGWVRRAESFPIVGVSVGVLLVGLLFSYILLKK